MPQRTGYGQLLPDMVSLLQKLFRRSHSMGNEIAGGMVYEKPQALALDRGSKFEIKMPRGGSLRGDT